MGRARQVRWLIEQGQVYDGMSLTGPVGLAFSAI